MNVNISIIKIPRKCFINIHLIINTNLLSFSSITKIREGCNLQKFTWIKILSTKAIINIIDAVICIQPHTNSSQKQKLMQL